MVVPAADVGKRYPHTYVRFDELSQLTQAVAKVPARIGGARGRFVFRGVGGLQHSYRVKGLLARAMQHRIDRLVVHRFEGVGEGYGARIAASDTKIIDVIHRDGRFASGKSAR